MFEQVRKRRGSFTESALLVGAALIMALLIAAFPVALFDLGGASPDTPAAHAEDRARARVVLMLTEASCLDRCRDLACRNGLLAGSTLDCGQAHDDAATN